MDITLIISSFIAGVLTILAPCVFPILPTIIGNIASSNNIYKPLVITFSLGISIIIFTILLKASTIFLGVSQEIWNLISGGIVIFFGILMLFPIIWDYISLKLKFEENSYAWLQRAINNDSVWNSVFIGFALGPVFSSCSPTYFLIIATILPTNFFTGLIYLVIYVFGLMLFLGLISYFGQKIIIKMKWATNPKGIFKQSMSILLILVGITIVTGYYKTIEAKVLNLGYDISKLEQKLFDAANYDNSYYSSQALLIEKYKEYSSENVKKAQDNGDYYAFFFHANWCSTCKYMERLILNNIDSFPDNSVIFKVNYDTENKLKREFGVLTQSMMIFFDDKGNVIDRKINPILKRMIKSLSRKKESIMKQEEGSSKIMIGEKELQEFKNAKSSYNTTQKYFNFLKAMSLEQATFAGGCFWCLEGPFEAERGVVEAFSGYASDQKNNLSYEEVSTGKTGAREVITIFYDSKIVSYNKLLKIFWRQIDPTDSGGQFADRGTQYTTAIFYHNDNQKQEALASKKMLEDSGEFSQIVTEILPAAYFSLAEEYHQDYYKKSSEHYNNYKVGSGRAKYINENMEMFNKIFNTNSLYQSGQKYIKPDKDKIKSMLSDESYAVTQESATESAFNNAYWNHHEHGIYVDIVTGEPLFSSTDKFDSGTGWPSFTRPIDDNFITKKVDNTILETRIELKSKVGDSHLGHVFNDGPKDKGGMRYCINSAALRFVPLKKMKAEGYGRYLHLFDSETGPKK